MQTKSYPFECYLVGDINNPDTWKFRILDKNKQPNGRLIESTRQALTTGFRNYLYNGIDRNDILDQLDEFCIDAFIKQEFPWAIVKKFVGVDESDDDYYGAPVAAVTTAKMPVQGVNEANIVAMRLPGKPPMPGVWKPASGEDQRFVQEIGHPQYLGEEATYLVDRIMDFYLVPVTYIAEVNGEPGAVIAYVRGNKQAQLPIEDAYDPKWIERAAALDYVCGQVDRGQHNWLTHPDDPKRPILIDNGLTFPAGDNLKVNSAFVTAWQGKPFTEDIIMSLEFLKAKRVIWNNIADLVGEGAAGKAQERVVYLIKNGMLPGKE